MATSSVSPVSQLPNLPQKLPTTQSEWQQIVNILQNWAQILQGSVTKFTLQATGFLAPAPSCSVVCRVVDNVAIAKLSFLTGTSNDTHFTLKGVPIPLQPASLSVTLPLWAQDNGASLIASASVVANSDTITLAPASGVWTASGAKGITPSVLAFLLD